RHRLRIADTLQRGDESALIGLTGDDGGPVVAAFQQTLAGVEPQAAAQFFRAGTVTGITLLGQDWADVLLKKLNARIDRDRWSAHERQRDDRCKPAHGWCLPAVGAGGSDGIIVTAVHRRDKPLAAQRYFPP